MTEPTTTPRFERAPGFADLHGASFTRRASRPPAVTVTWKRVDPERARESNVAELELLAGLEASADGRWFCRTPFLHNWLQIVASAPCSEVLVTARVGDDASAKHSVLELAERLTRELASSQPLIRVRFLPASGAERAARRRA